MELCLSRHRHRYRPCTKLSSCPLNCGGTNKPRTCTSSPSAAIGVSRNLTRPRHGQSSNPRWSGPEGGTGDHIAFNCSAGIEAIRLPHPCVAPGRTVLAGAVLRLQRLDSTEAGREAPLSSSQPGCAWSGREAGTMAMVELPPPRYGPARDRGDRVEVDGASS